VAWPARWRTRSRLTSGTTAERGRLAPLLASLGARTTLGILVRRLVLKRQIVVDPYARAKRSPREDPSGRSPGCAVQASALSSYTRRPTTCGSDGGGFRAVLFPESVVGLPRLRLSRSACIPERERRAPTLSVHCRRLF
jgi:hypothetical protein